MVTTSPQADADQKSRSKVIPKPVNHCQNDKSPNFWRMKFLWFYGELYDKFEDILFTPGYLLCYFFV